jgi:hypothetical protein
MTAEINGPSGPQKRARTEPETPRKDFDEILA